MMRPINSIVAAALLGQGESADRIGMRPDGFFVDALNRVRIFRGFNDIQGKAKGNGPFDGTNYIPKYLEHEDVLDQLEAMGFNGFRLGMMWAAVQPTSDLVPDESYLARMMNVTRRLEGHHMYGLLDMHKDTVGHPDSYDGYPRWLVNLTVPKHSYPWPFTPEQMDNLGWGFAYFTEQDAQVLQETYDNTHGGMDAMEEFWRTVARYYKDQTNVLGYELINEPWAGNEWENPLRLLPGYAGKHNLEPAHKKLSKAIRQADNDTLIFFEPVTWGMFMSGQAPEPELAGSGFDELPDEKSVFTWHYYCMFAGDDKDVYPLQNKIACDDFLGPQVFNAVAKDKKKLKTSSFLSEWGGKSGNYTLPRSTGVKELEFIMDRSDESFESWTFYDLVSVTDHEGNLQPTSMYTMARPFAQATAGTPQKMSFDSRRNKFTFEYEVDPSIPAPTEIAVPSIRYPDGFDVKLFHRGALGTWTSTDGLTWEMAADRVAIIAVSNAGQSTDPKWNAKIVIAPKSTASMLV